MVNKIKNNLNYKRKYKGAVWNYFLFIFLFLLSGSLVLIGIGFGIRTMSLARIQHAATQAAITYARQLVKLRDNRLSKTTSGSLGALGVKNGDSLNLSQNLNKIDFSFAGLESLVNAGSATIPLGTKSAVLGSTTLEYTEASQVLLYNLWKEKIPDASWVNDIRQNQCYTSHDQSHFSLNELAKTNTCAVTDKILQPFMSLKWVFLASKYGEGVCCSDQAVNCGQPGVYDFCVVVKVTGRIDPLLEGGLPFLQSLDIIKGGDFSIQARADVKNMVEKSFDDDSMASDTISSSKTYPQTCEFSCNHPPTIETVSTEPVEALINSGEITPDSLAKCLNNPEDCIREEPKACKWKSKFPEEEYLQWNPDLIKLAQPGGGYFIKDPSSNLLFPNGLAHYNQFGKKQGRYVADAMSELCDHGESKCGSKCLLSVHCAGATDGCTLCSEQGICIDDTDECGHFCTDDDGCKGSTSCPNCIDNICSSDFCNKPCAFNSECAPSAEVGCNECLDGRCSKNCQWDVNNLVPAELEKNSGLKECDLANLHGNYIDGAACSKDGDLCSAPWNEPQPAELFKNLTADDLDDPAVKVFRCACTNPKNAEDAFVWDFQRYVFTDEIIANCPPADSLPGSKVDNNKCETEGALCKTVEDHIFGKKVFKCEETSNTSGSTECRWDLNTFTTMKLKLKAPNMPACIPEDNNPDKYNNVACTVPEEGHLCYKPQPEPFTLQQMKNGWRKRFQCDCSPTPPKRSCSWDVNGFAKATTEPTADLPECTFPEDKQYIDGSECENTGDGCLTPWKETPDTNGNCVNNLCDNFEGRTCSSSDDCPASFPYLDGTENDEDIKMVKLFRCSCGNGNQPSWDFQRFLDTTAVEDMALAVCPDASKLPGQKVDNSPCDAGREDRCRTGDRIFRCEPPLKGCRLDLNNFTPAGSPFPECPANDGDINDTKDDDTVNNTDCSAQGEGWRCIKTGAEKDQWTLEEFREGWKKIFRCDCNETLSCTNYCN